MEAMEEILGLVEVSSERCMYILLPLVIVCRELITVQIKFHATVSRSLDSWRHLWSTTLGRKDYHGRRQELYRQCTFAALISLLFI